MKTINYCRYCSILLFIFVISGCATPMNMSSVELNDLAPNEGIIVGSLNVTGGEDFWGQVNWELIAKNDEDSTFMPAKIYSITAKGDEGEGIFASKLPAGNYTFYSLIQKSFLGLPLFNAKANFSFTVQPGKPVYIGRLLVKLSPGYINIYSKIYYNVEDAKDDIAEKAKNSYGIDLNNTTSSLATTSGPTPHNAALEKYPELPVILDGKGLFVVSKSHAAQLKIKSVKVSDWLFKDDGELVDRDRHGFFEYDVSGNISEFSGHKDQAGYIKNEYIYVDDNLFEMKYYIKTEDGMNYVGKISFKYFDGDRSESINFDNSGNIKTRKKFMYDTASNNVEISVYDANGNAIGKGVKKFDDFGNIIEKVAGNAKKIYSYDKRKIIISHLNQNNQLHSTIEYTFDNNWNLLTYLRKSGDGEYWDKFSYKYNADALPVEKVWSRKETFIVQDPYELTKYSYQHFK